MNGSARSSAGLVWGHQRLVWWVFVVNLVLAFLGSLPARVTLSAVLDHSLESARLVTGFDITGFALMLERPDVSMKTAAPTAVGAVLVFLVYLLFIDGGVVAVFLDDRKMSRSEFFENSGLFFWRMVRLALYSLVPFALLAAAHGGIHGWADKLSSDAPQERLGFFVDAGSNLVILVVALFVRMWFDVTQAYVVRDNERQLLRVLGRSFKIVFKSGRLFGEYVAIGLFAVATFGVGIWIWLGVPHSASGVSFLVLEVVTLTQIASRLWMKAASARWVSLLPSEVAMAVPALETPAVESGRPVVEPGYSE